MQGGPVTRRVAVRQLGKAGLAVAVLGMACSNDSTASPASRQSPATSPSASATAPPPAAPATDSVGETRWERVDFGFVSAYLLYRGGEAALVDTGQTGSKSAIEAGLTAIGLDWDSVGNVVVTHRHGDHVGSAEEVAEAAPDATFHIGTADADALTGIDDVVTVGNGDMVFDLEIIETPGHTPGHICVFDRSAGILVSGDALSNTEGALTGSNPRFTSNLQQANESVVVLAGYEYEVVLFGHGEPMLTGGSDAVAELASTL